MIGPPWTVEPEGRVVGERTDLRRPLVSGHKEVLCGSVTYPIEVSVLSERPNPSWVPPLPEDVGLVTYPTLRTQVLDCPLSRYGGRRLGQIFLIRDRRSTPETDSHGVQYFVDCFLYIRTTVTTRPQGGSGTLSGLLP